MTPRDVLIKFMTTHPHRKGDLLRYCENKPTGPIEEWVNSLPIADVQRLVDRAKYITGMTSARPPRPRIPMCGTKVIYDEKGANTKANRVWEAGRGKMRVYLCPHCDGYHLTHTELK